MAGGIIEVETEHEAVGSRYFAVECLDTGFTFYAQPGEKVSVVCDAFKVVLDPITDQEVNGCLKRPGGCPYANHRVAAWWHVNGPTDVSSEETKK